MKLITININEYYKYEKLHSKIIYLKDIPDNSEVYFLDTTKFPIKEFEKIYPTCKRVKFFKNITSNTILISNNEFPLHKHPTFKFNSNSTVIECHSFSTYPLHLLDKRVILVKDLKSEDLTKTSILTLDVADKIINLFNSYNTHKLGLSLLYQYNFNESNKLLISYIFSKMITWWTNPYKSLYRTSKFNNLYNNVKKECKNIKL